MNVTMDGKLPSDEVRVQDSVGATRTTSFLNRVHDL